jgi:hypothetical protein
MIFGKFNVIWWFSGYENIREPVSEMRAFIEPDKISGCQPASNALIGWPDNNYFRSVISIYNFFTVKLL